MPLRNKGFSVCSISHLKFINILTPSFRGQIYRDGRKSREIKQGRKWNRQQSIFVGPNVGLNAFKVCVCVRERERSVQLHLNSQDVCEGWIFQCEIDCDLTDGGECSFLSAADRPLCCV